MVVPWLCGHKASQRHRNKTTFIKHVVYYPVPAYTNGITISTTHRLLRRDENKISVSVNTVRNNRTVSLVVHPQNVT